MNAAEQIQAMDERIVEEALRRLRWEGMEADMPARLIEVCEHAIEAARWTHLRMAMRDEIAVGRALVG